MDVLKFSDGRKKFTIGLFFYNSAREVIKEEFASSIKKFIHEFVRGEKNEFSLSPYPRLSKGSLSVSHKICKNESFLALALSRDVEAIGVDLELEGNISRCINVLRRYGVSDYWNPIEQFTILEASVKCYSVFLNRKVYFSEVVIEENSVFLRTFDARKATPLTMSYQAFRIGLVYI
ncbi:MAG: hypothetical protein NZO16_05265 [Deltaproteobacteria bacterium]|nr:hypothetical protein [Deltaproteobacteria bacterium]